uniref:Maestro heat like repeat family member 9 n=1 Tax=Propithecus coquereli TaxID=379532 RepID=A0A2K6FPF1_PROCO
MFIEVFCPIFILGYLFFFLLSCMSSLYILEINPLSHAHVATSLWDAYSGLLSHQSMILSMNSSFVDPLLQFETQLKIIKSSFNMLVAIPSFDKVKKMGTSADDVEDLVNLYQNILNIYEETLLILVSKDLYKLQILKEMILWMSEDGSYLQERIMVIITKVLHFASREVRGNTSVDAPCLGALAAELCLLCSHADSSITEQASFGLHYLLHIAKCQTGKNDSHEHNCFPPSSDVAFLSKSFQDKSKISQRIGQTLLPSLLTDFVWSLLKKLSAFDYKIASDAASLLKLTLENHAQKLIMVSKIVDVIYKQLCENSSHCMKHAMLQIITLLIRTSPKKVIFQLMDYPVPINDTLTLMWQAAGSEAKVAPHVLKTILLVLKGKPGERQENLMERRRSSLDVTNMMPVVASQALCTLLPIASYKKAVAQFFPHLLMALMLQLFYSGDLRLKRRALKHNQYAQDALRALLNCSGLQEVDIALKKKNCWNQFSQALYQQHGVQLIARTLCEFKFPQFPETLYYLYKLSVEGPRRSEDSIVTVIFLTELLNNFLKDPFPEEFLVLFRNWINDPNPSVSKLSLQKISSMAPVINEVENVCSLLICILDAFLCKDVTVVMRALLTLRRLLAKLDKVTYSTLCNRIAYSYCPLMDHSNASVRSIAIRHFGELLKDMCQYTWMLNSVIIGGLVPLILFLEDKEKRVVEACKHTLEICASQLKWPISYLFKDNNYSFELVVLSICNNLLTTHRNHITDLISDSLGFLGSSRANLRRASTVLIGYLTKVGGCLLLRDEIEVMLGAIERVLRDEDPVIKELAEITHNIIRGVLHTTTSSTLKQNFQRFFKFFYIKKLKPLYNYNLFFKNQTDNPMENKDIKNDK